MVTMIVSLSVQRASATGPPKKERGFYATCKSCASFSLRRHAALQGAHELPQPAALHALHDALHLQELLQQPVHVLYLHARAPGNAPPSRAVRSEEHTSELQSPCNLVCRLLLEKKKKHTSQRALA